MPRPKQAPSRRYEVYRAAIDSDGLSLSSEPVATARTLRRALELAADHHNHGPEGAAIVTPAGKTIYAADEYDAAKRRAAPR